MAQATNFAGKWTPDAEKTAAARAGAGGGAAAGGGGRAGGGRGGGMAGGGDMTITQDAKTLTITRTGPNGETSTVYNLDGTESKVTMGQNEATVKVKWDGAKMIVSQTSQGQNGPQTTVTTWSIVDGELLQERAPRTEGQPTTKTYYKKAM